MTKKRGKKNFSDGRGKYKFRVVKNYLENGITYDGSLYSIDYVMSTQLKRRNFSQKLKSSSSVFKILNF
jgi:hypothetical protein